MAETVFSLTECLSSDASPDQEVIQQAVALWLTTEIYRPDSDQMAEVK